MRIRALVMTVLTVFTFFSTTSEALAQKSKKARRPPTPRTGTLRVEVSVPGAAIVVDGETVATSPLAEPLPLPVGTHTLKVTKAGHAEFLDTVKITTNQTTVVEVELLPFAAVVNVSSVPPGADVSLDGKLVGQTPLRLEVEPGQHELRLSTDGYHDGVRELALQAGESYEVDVALIALPPPPKRAARSDRPIYKKWWFWAATGALAIGTTALVIGSSSGGDPLGSADRVIDVRF